MHPVSRTLLLGHRGAPSEAPENTMASFHWAVAHGADGVELDVQRSHDGAAVVIHDATLERTTGAPGEVGLLNWAEISRARAGGEPVPRLEEVVEWAVSAAIWLNVEIKTRGIAAECVRIARDAGWLDRVIFSSFHADVVAELGTLAAEATRFLLTEQWDAATLAAARSAGTDGICLHDRAATPQALAELRREALPTIVWTVDDAARARALTDAGVLGIISNRPNALR